MNKEIFFQIIRKSIREELFNENSEYDKFKTFEELNQVKGTFITLNLNGILKGCIGSLVAHKTLLEDIIINSKKAAFHDPRFKPLTKEEFKNIEIELSILSKAIKLNYNSVDELKEKITNKHGVILKMGSKQSTFLPQVWEQLTTFELFFERLCEKAGLNCNCINEKPEIFLYNVQKFKENKDFFSGCGIGNGLL